MPRVRKWIKFEGKIKLKMKANSEKERPASETTEQNNGLDNTPSLAKDSASSHRGLVENARVYWQDVDELVYGAAEHGIRRHLGNLASQ